MSDHEIEVPENGAAADLEESLNRNVFVRELMRSQVEATRKQNMLMRELLEVLRDVRDELAYARTERQRG